MQFCVGFYLHSKKAQRYLTKKVMSLAEECGIELRTIDRDVPLEQQGPFHVIVHKCSSDIEWEFELEAYSKMHPEVTIVDPVDKIDVLRNRATMLSSIPNLRDGFVCSAGKMRVFIPQQIEIAGNNLLDDVERSLEQNNMEYPLLVKPKWAAGRAGCHMLGFVRDRSGLSMALNPQLNSMNRPFIAQQVIPHDSVIYKVYVVGEYVVCSPRPSLVVSKCVGCFQLLPRISSKAKPDHSGQDDLPPEELTTALANLLRRRLEIQLFNFDLIKESGAGQNYYIVDINYFPGIDKIDNFEEIFVNFLVNTCHQQCN